MKRIESRNNPTIKNTVALKTRREREMQESFFFEGAHLLEEYLRFGHAPDAVFVREDVAERYAPLINECSNVFEVTSSVYDKLTEEKAPQGIFTVSSFLNNVVFVGKDISYEELPSRIKGNSIMLVDLQDTGNVGTVIRTAATLGCDVLLCGSCADVYSPKTVRATMGAMFANDIYICPSPESAVKAMQKGNKRVIAAALSDKASVLGGFEIYESDCFAVGNEGQGLKSEFIAECDMTCIIPMSGRTESLNAASASSILLWEARRGRI